MSTRDLIFNLKKHIKGYDSWKTYQRLLNNQTLSSDELQEINWQKRKRLITHAYNNTTFYRKKYDSVGFHPNDLIHPDVFEKIPVLTKDEIRKNSNEMFEIGISTKFLKKSVTGGSTGKPIEVYHDLRFPSQTLGWRMLNWWGLSPAEKQAIIYRITPSLNNNSWSTRLRQWPARNIYLDASNMTKSRMNNFIKEYVQLKPTIIMGYVGAVEYLATYILDNNIQLKPPQLIWVTSSPVSVSQRLLFKQAFSAPVLDQYGCCEVYWLAAQCPVGEGLHFFYDARHIEFLDSKYQNVPLGDYGEVALTDLENYAFPLIRYLNGDSGRWSPQSCTCGCNLPLIDSIKGRITDNLILPDGSSLAGDYLTTIFDNFPHAVKQFQVFQHTNASITLKVVPNVTYEQSVQEIKQVIKNLINKVDKQVAVRLLEVDSIPHDKGKTRFIIKE